MNYLAICAQYLTGRKTAAISTKMGEKFVVWHKLSLPKPRDVRDESRGISIVRRYLTPEGGEADLSKLSLGEMLIAELALKASHSIGGDSCFEERHAKEAEATAFLGDVALRMAAPLSAARITVEGARQNSA